MTLTRRRFVRVAAGGVVAGALGAGEAGRRTGAGLPLVEVRDLGVRGLPGGLDGLRVLLVADAHAGAWMDRTRLSRTIALLGSLDADLALVAGDLVDMTAADGDVRDLADALGELARGVEVLAVPGNHDHRAGVRSLGRELERVGVPLLRGEPLRLDHGGERLVILGLDDPGVGRFDPPRDRAVDALLSQAPPGFPILLTHRPAAFDAAARSGVPLTLAGHTHGGQIGLPWRDLSPARLLSRYVRGLYERDGSRLIVTSGVGTGSVPVRLGVPPSVELVTLRSAESRPVAP